MKKCSTFCRCECHEQGLDPLYGNPSEQLRKWAREVLPTIPAPRPGTPGHYTIQGSNTETIRQIDATEKALYCLKMKLASGRALLSGFRYIPNEILSRILAIHLNSNEDGALGYGLSQCVKRLAPLEVCRRWRAVALSSPSCWTHLAIRANSTRAKSAQKHLTRQLQLGGNLPFHLTVSTFHININSEFGSDSGKLLVAVRNSVDGQVSRLHSYMEMGSPVAHLSLLPTLLKGSAPNLTHLYLTMLHLGRGTTFPEHCKLPVLKHLHISRARADRLFQLSWRCPALLSFVCQDYYLPNEDPEDEHEPHPPSGIPGLGDYPLISSLFNFGQLERITLSQDSVQTAFRWTKKPRSIVRLPSIKTVTLIGNASLPIYYEERANRNPFDLSTLDHFLQTFTHLNHLILHGVSMLWPNGQRHQFKASLRGIERITFEGVIRLTPIHAALKLFPNLRSVKFEACLPSFIHGNILEICNLGTCSVFEPESLKGEAPRALEPKYPKRLIVKVVDLLTGESPSSQELSYRSTLRHLEFSGLTIDDSDIQSLLKLLHLHEEHQKCSGTSTPYLGILTLRGCFYTGVNDNEGGEDATDVGYAYPRVPLHDTESMGYHEAKELFEDLPEEFEDGMEAEEEEMYRRRRWTLDFLP